MQCKDSFSEDKQQMSIDGYAAAAQTQVHPVSAHLLPLGNKFLPKVGESALYFCFFIFFFCTHCIFTIPDVALLHSPRTEMQKQRRCAAMRLSLSVLSDRTAPPHGPKHHCIILGDLLQMKVAQLE